VIGKNEADGGLSWWRRALDLWRRMRAVQMMRGRLPDRRPSMTFEATWNNHQLSGTVGFDPVTGRVLEVFGDPQKGSMQATIADAMVLVSIALQRGATVDELRRSLLIETDYTGAETPASPIGAILKAVAEVQAEIWGDCE
jgi:hypothetical protein